MMELPHCVSNLTSGDPEEVATNDWLILFVDGVGSIVYKSPLIMSLLL